MTIIMTRSMIITITRDHGRGDTGFIHIMTRSTMILSSTIRFIMIHSITVTGILAWDSDSVIMVAFLDIVHTFHTGLMPRTDITIPIITPIIMCHIMAGMEKATSNMAHAAVEYVGAEKVQPSEIVIRLTEMEYAAVV